MKKIITDKIVLEDVIKWIDKTKSMHSLQKIRSKTKKRIQSILNEDYNPLKNIPTEKKREIIKDLFVDENGM